MDFLSCLNKMFVLIGIREEIAAIENKQMDINLNLLKLSPHTQEQVMADEWNRPYSRIQAAFPMVYFYLLIGKKIF